MKQNFINRIFNYALRTIAACMVLMTTNTLNSCKKEEAEQYYSKDDTITFLCQENITKTAPITALTEDVGLFAYMHTGTGGFTSALPQLSYNKQLHPIGNQFWKSPDNLTWPSSGYVSFLAYYPYLESATVGHPQYSNSMIQLSAPNILGTPSLTYTVPEDVSKHVDLLTSSAHEYLHTYPLPIVRLVFNHTLTAIQFKTGAKLPAGITIKSISLKNIYSKGRHNFGSTGSNAWMVYTYSKKSFTLPLNYVTDGYANKEITTPDQTFFLLPQALPSDAELEVKMIVNGSESTLTKSLSGKIWGQGEKIVYNI